MAPARTVTATPVTGLGEIEPGTDLGREIAGLARLRPGDVLAISQKVVSKAEGRLRRLSEVAPGPEAAELAAGLGKDPRMVELILSESRSVLRAERGVLITETRHGYVCANAGVDASNMPDADTVALLPADPDESARRIRSEIHESGSPVPAVVITDSFGRAWRLGQCEVAIGCAGLDPIDDWRGRPDSRGRELAATAIAVADQAAAASDLARSKTSGTPAVVVGGLDDLVIPGDGPGCASQIRPAEEDLFR